MPHPPHLTLVPLFAAIPVRGAADTKEGGTGREGEGSGGGERGWHRPWESRARVAMTTSGSATALSGGAVGWGLGEGSKLGTAPCGGSFMNPHLSSVFLENILACTCPLLVA
jgi:hypothetical protein